MTKARWFPVWKFELFLTFEALFNLRNCTKLTKTSLSGRSDEGAYICSKVLN